MGFASCQATNSTELSYDLPADDPGAWWTQRRVPMHPCRQGPFKTPTWEGWRMSGKPAESSPVVFVVDDDASIRESLTDLFLSIGLCVETFASAAEFLQSKLPEAPGCLVLDVRLPGLSGLDF